MLNRLVMGLIGSKPKEKESGKRTKKIGTVRRILDDPDDYVLIAYSEDGNLCIQINRKESVYEPDDHQTQ